MQIWYIIYHLIQTPKKRNFRWSSIIKNISWEPSMRPPDYLNYVTLCRIVRTVLIFNIHIFPAKPEFIEPFKVLTFWFQEVPILSTHTGAIYIAILWQIPLCVAELILCNSMVTDSWFIFDSVTQPWAALKTSFGPFSIHIIHPCYGLTTLLSTGSG